MKDQNHQYWKNTFRENHPKLLHVYVVMYVVIGVRILTKKYGFNLTLCA